MKEENKIISRLDTIIILLLSMLKESNNFPKLSVIFHQLKNAGLTNEEIGTIFDKNPSQVAKIAYEFKRPNKGNGKKNKK